MTKHQRLVLAVVGTLVLAGLAFVFTRTGVPGWESISEAEAKQIAIDVANAHIVTLDKYKRWKEEGLEYEIASEPYHYSITSPLYRPDHWTVWYDFPEGPTDQGIRITVDVRTKTVVFVEEDQA